jgi:trehalose 6-phosphate phosphatase
MQKVDAVQERRWSLLLDFDGTLADLAADPMKVTVDPALRRAIHEIATEGGIPLAIVTGRPVEVLDRFLRLPHLAVSGNHGTEIRLPGSGLITRHVPPMPKTLSLALLGICAEFGCSLEDKQQTAVVRVSAGSDFYAVAEELRSLLHGDFQSYVSWSIGRTLEIHHRDFSKVTGIREILKTGPFNEMRAHLYIGDDAEIYPGLDRLIAENVALVSVGPESQSGFGSPQEVREFLGYLSSRTDGGNSLLAALAALQADMRADSLKMTAQMKRF